MNFIIIEHFLPIKSWSERASSSAITIFKLLLQVQFPGATQCPSSGGGWGSPGQRSGCTQQPGQGLGRGGWLSKGHRSPNHNHRSPNHAVHFLFHFIKTLTKKQESKFRHVLLGLESLRKKKSKNYFFYLKASVRERGIDLLLAHSPNGHNG